MVAVYAAGLIFKQLIPSDLWDAETKENQKF